MPSATCTTCGTPLPGRMLGGLCPTCVRRVAFAEPSHPGDTAPEDRAAKAHHAGWEPPSVGEVAALLPAGAYTVESLIGRGGMGAVYKGWQKSLHRYVAIKILPPGLTGGDADFAARFKREARAMAKLRHPGIIPVHDAGETADGLLYFVMDFVEGTDVQKMIAARGRLPPGEALSIVTRVLDALACAHQHGIIHRDIKPANIMVDAGGHVLVADFGLAHSSAPDTTLLTGSHIAMGTPDFMPPEARSGAAHVDERADLFAVGVMLYQMLTGQLPHGRFEPPSRIVPGVDKRLDRIVDRTLQPDRDKRYSSAIEVRAALEPILTRTLARRTGSTPGAGRPKRTSLLIAAAALVLAAGSFFAWKKAGKWPAQSSVRTDAAEPSDTTAQGTVRTTSAALFPGPGLPVTQASATATKDAPFVNTLGMKFVPVPITGGPTDGQRVLFSVWETRVQDYAEFASETNRNWPDPGFSQEPTHPAVNMIWDDAQAFCAWLTQRERKAGMLGATERYRLPSDHEWSCAVGIGHREDPAKQPRDKTQRIADLFPWGSAWPPPANTGNFAGEELLPTKMVGSNNLQNFTIISGFRDGHLGTAPVASFAPSPSGLHDLDGNVREWCEDWFDATHQGRVTRGAGWNMGLHDGLLSCNRAIDPPDNLGNGRGFRCVLEVK